MRDWLCHHLMGDLVLDTHPSRPVGWRATTDGGPCSADIEQEHKALPTSALAPLMFLPGCTLQSLYMNAREQVPAWSPLRRSSSPSSSESYNTNVLVRELICRWPPPHGEGLQRTTPQCCLKRKEVYHLPLPQQAQW